MNLFNWIGILLGAGVYGVLIWLIHFVHVEAWALFAFTAAMMLPVALLYRPRETPKP